MTVYGEEGSQLYQNMAKLYLFEAVQKIKNAGDEAGCLLCRRR